MKLRKIDIQSKWAFLTLTLSNDTLFSFVERPFTNITRQKWKPSQSAATQCFTSDPCLPAFHLKTVNRASNQMRPTSIVVGVNLLIDAPTATIAIETHGFWANAINKLRTKSAWNQVNKVEMLVPLRTLLHLLLLRLCLANRLLLLPNKQTELVLRLQALPVALVLDSVSGLCSLWFQLSVALPSGRCTRTKIHTVRPDNF